MNVEICQKRAEHIALQEFELASQTPSCGNCVPCLRVKLANAVAVACDLASQLALAKPLAELYDRVRETLGIDGDVIGYVNALKAKIVELERRATRKEWEP